MHNELLKEGRHLTLERGKALPYIITPIHYSPLARPYNIILKRAFDITVSVLVILGILSWLLPVLALCIKIDSRGPVFFLQQRTRKNGQAFRCIKLRTMVVNKEADTLTASFQDKRVTPLGNFLRVSHLDELPQFINVLLGEMSVIGPRPHMIAENDKYNSIFSYYNDRHLVKPGITGLAQSHGCYGPIMDIGQIEQKTAYDLFYINNWSLMMDIRIMARTITMIYRKYK
jgi:putative colanic acid biosynthesis UDP-glucose lipid carrier transferase